MFSAEFLSFVQVIFIDIVLSGDNAVIIGALAASLPEEKRNKAILWGMGMAVVMRIILSLGVVWLIQIPGIMIFGGVLLAYVAYKMYLDLSDNGVADGSTVKANPVTFFGALTSIALADLSMSLDNVLGVVGAAGQHVWALVFGLVLSVSIMAFAAKMVSSLIDKYRWIGWVGLGLIIFISAKMIYEGILPFV